MFHFIPAELRALPRWIHWQYEEKDGKRTKVPYTPGQPYHASSTKSESWRSFAEAEAALPTSSRDGLGFVFGEGYFGVDLDHMCVGSEPTAEARDILSHFTGAYVERSPSGEGVHVIGKGEVGSGRKLKRQDGTGVEIYDRGRFFTMTGNLLPNRAVADPLPACQAGIDWLLATYFQREPASHEQRASPGAAWAHIQIVLSENPAPPFHKLALIENACTEWKPTWELKRRMPTDQSFSAYDQALADMMAAQSWTPQEMCDTLLAFRAHHGVLSKVGRVDYYQQTIFKAQAYAERYGALASLQMAGSLSPEETTAVITHLTGLDVMRYVQTGESPAQFRVYLANGKAVPLGTAEKARSQAVWQTVAQEHLGTPFAPLNRQQWQQLLIALGHIVEREETEQPTHVREFLEHLTLYQNRHTHYAAQPLTHDALTEGFPFIEDGCWHLSIGHFLQWLRMSKVRIDSSLCMQELKIMGAASTEVHRRFPSGKSVKRRYWVLPNPEN